MRPPGPFLSQGPRITLASNNSPPLPLSSSHSYAPPGPQGLNFNLWHWPPPVLGPPGGHSPSSQGPLSFTRQSAVQRALLLPGPAPAPRQITFFSKCHSAVPGGPLASDGPPFGAFSDWSGILWNPSSRQRPPSIGNGPSPSGVRPSHGPPPIGNGPPPLFNDPPGPVTVHTVKGSTVQYSITF